jgi:hypothetical protein
MGSFGYLYTSRERFFTKKAQRGGQPVIMSILLVGVVLFREMAGIKIVKVAVQLYLPTNR